MRDYELTFIVRTLATDEEVNQAIDQVITYIEFDDYGKVNSIDRKLFGRRRLAYEIDGQREGHYVVMKASVDPDHILELETELKLFDPVLRYLLVRDDQKAEKRRKSNSFGKNSDTTGSTARFSADNLASARERTVIQGDTQQ